MKATLKYKNRKISSMVMIGILLCAKLNNI